MSKILYFPRMLKPRSNHWNRLHLIPLALSLFFEDSGPLSEENPISVLVRLPQRMPWRARLEVAEVQSPTYNRRRARLFRTSVTKRQHISMEGRDVYQAVRLISAHDIDQLWKLSCPGCACILCQKDTVETEARHSIHRVNVRMKIRNGVPDPEVYDSNHSHQCPPT